jgi:hypothetical protein
MFSQIDSENLHAKEPVTIRQSIIRNTTLERYMDEHGGYSLALPQEESM